MAISLNSVISFNATKLQLKYQDTSRCCIGASIPKTIQFTPFLIMSGSRMVAKDKKFGRCLSVADSDQLAADTSDKDSGNAGADEVASLNPPVKKVQIQANVNAETGSVTSEVSNEKQGSPISPNSQPTTKRSSLTARERLRAARVLSRYTESKASKPAMGSRVLEALKESDRGKKKSRLPEAPTNLFDDSKRGLSDGRWSFQFPGGFDLFIIVFSFVFISTLMFATTYLVWKVGAIHFNEY
ncbi:hypothetical protein L6164_030090 [Bauhinia variegata]|uniref:Uncharacterized protein n=1 Tax=Bauhinia variegata TaxID=167791 RepID=A0ACB9LC38_BAUVA|nr:hypothetical protein L6164_030090 [Bauhinia variegata]